MTMDRVRLWMWAFRIVCVAVLIAGSTATLKTKEEHWVERSGEVLVALALLLTYAQFRYEIEHHSVDRTARETAATLIQRKEFVSTVQETDLLNRVEAAARARYDAERAYILLNALGVAAIGETVSAFGGVALHLFS